MNFLSVSRRIHKNRFYSGNILKKSFAPFKPKKFFIVILGEINIKQNDGARLKNTHFCSDVDKIDHFSNKIFQFVKNKNAFCAINEFKFKNWQIIAQEDSQSQWVYNQLDCQLKKNMNAVLLSANSKQIGWKREFGPNFGTKKQNFEKLSINSN